jgi:predicted RNase H-like HicB family nuclease
VVFYLIVIVIERMSEDIFLLRRGYTKKSNLSSPLNLRSIQCYTLLASDQNLQQENTMNIHTFTAVIHKEDALYVAECPEVGTVSQGTTIEEAIANLREATELYLEEFPMPSRLD